MIPGNTKCGGFEPQCGDALHALGASQPTKSNYVVMMLQVYLNPERDLSDMPLKTFYRYVLPESSIAGWYNPLFLYLLHKWCAA